jgi:DNA-binding LacI/PurR family transcriptional regulator
VAEETRRRVLEVSRALGVFPKSRGKRSPRYGRGGDESTHTTAAILMDMSLSSMFLSELIVAIQRALAEMKFHCVIQFFSGEYADFVRALGGVRPPLATACLAVGHFTDKEVTGVLGANPRAVFVDYMPGPGLKAPIDVVTYDNVAAARMATEELLAAGCERPVCLQGMAQHHFSRSMREGFLSALGRSEFERGRLLTGDFSAAGGYSATKRALGSGTEFDGIFTTDEPAIGAMRALREAGRRVPEDVRVMGCDGIELGREQTPPLSTVVLDRTALGRRAVARLMEVIGAPEHVCEQVLLAPRLEMRGTCVPARSKAV